MWFAALDDPRRLAWFQRFLERLLENEPTVTTLLAKNPFADKAPPAYIRAQFYEYTYAGAVHTEAVHTGAAHTGLWWNRRYLGLYFPAVHLKQE
jgi:hypothetical protein